MIRTICVCGAGTMGSGIAQVAAMSGFRTLLYDVNAEVLQKGGASIKSGLRILQEKGKITPEDSLAIRDRLQLVDDHRDCIADLVIEAIIERTDIKLDLFQKLAAINDQQTILASNTSSLSITGLAEKIPHPERVAGMHFFNPAPIMKLVEVVTTTHTNDHTRETILSVTRQMGKTPVLCKDAPGFIVNHVARPYYLEALKLIEEGFTDIDTVDALMETIGFKMGPFRLMDLIGNDVNYAVSCSVYQALGRPERLQPSPIQKEKVKNGELGKKSGQGFYAYPMTP